MSRGQRLRAAAALVLLALLAVACQWYAMEHYSRIPSTGAVTLYLPGSGGSYRTLSKAEQRTAQPVAFTAWNQQEGQTLASKSLGRTHRTGVMTVYGDSTLVLPAMPMLLPGSAGCLLDRDSCYALFGDFSPVGELVTLEGREYIIVGVFDYPAPMLVRQGDSDADWDRVTLSLENLPDPDGGAQEFAMRHGLSPYGVVATDLWRSVAGFFARLLPLVVVAGLLFWGLVESAHRRATPVAGGLLVLGTLLGTALLWRVFGLGITLPVTMVPARWSDFEFWSALVVDTRAQLWLLFTLPKELPQGMPMGEAMTAALYGMAALLLSLPPLGGLWQVLIKHSKNRKKFQL